ncbi:MAG: dihydrodipicolinate reductase, partial [Myxococcota bacterium]
YRVIQWATGSVGGEALKGILMHPQLDLAGVKVYSDEKAGTDAGSLCGMPDTGVIATTSVDDILAIDADCVSYMPNRVDLDEVCALLRSGKNVACSPFLFYGEHLPEEDRSKVADACATGGSSVHGTGIHPGFVGMVLPLALSGMSRSIEKIVIQERADWAFYDSPQITFDNMRFGQPPERVDLDQSEFLAFNCEIFKDQIVMLARAFGAPLDEVTLDHEVRTTESGHDVMHGRIEPDTVYAQRYTWRGICRGEARIEIDALWHVGGDYPSDWPKPSEGWTVTIEGEPALRAKFTSLASFEHARERSLAQHTHASDIATAMQVVNSIPALCESEPGIRGTFELAPVFSGLGMR